jgi:hypothetical protein
VLAAPLATLAAVGAGVGASGLATPDHPPTAAPATADLSAAVPHGSAAPADSGFTAAVTDAYRSVSVSRDLDRLALVPVAQKWATADLNLYAQPADTASVTGELASSKKVGITGRTSDGFTQVVVGNKARWVHSDYLTAKKPVDPASMGLVLKPCAASASVEHGLVPDMIRAWEAVCNAFPQVSTYGGLANRPEHNTGHAVDAMVYGDSALGYQIAEFLQAHASELNLYDIIYRQHIWTPVRSSEGWRLMPNRGSETANHMDHVHFGVN